MHAKLADLNHNAVPASPPTCAGTKAAIILVIANLSAVKYRKFQNVTTDYRADRQTEVGYPINQAYLHLVLSLRRQPPCRDATIPTTSPDLTSRALNKTGVQKLWHRRPDVSQMPPTRPKILGYFTDNATKITLGMMLVASMIITTQKMALQLSGLPQIYPISASYRAHVAHKRITAQLTP